MLIIMTVLAASLLTYIGPVRLLELVHPEVSIGLSELTSTCEIGRIKRNEAQSPLPLSEAWKRET